MLSLNHCFCRKEIRITYFEDVSIDLDVQHAKGVRVIILLSVAVWLYLIFPPYLIHCVNFWKALLDIKSVF
jgi:hypothetical protein